MSLERAITRRAFVRAAVLGAGGLALTSCAAPALSPSPSSQVPSPAATGPLSSAGPTASPTGTLAATASPTANVAPLRHRIARLLVVGFRGLTVAASDPIARAIAEDGLGGVILFDLDEELGARNVASPPRPRSARRARPRSRRGRTGSPGRWPMRGSTSTSRPWST